MLRSEMEETYKDFCGFLKKYEALRKDYKPWANAEKYEKIEHEVFDRIRELLRPAPKLWEHIKKINSILNACLHTFSEEVQTAVLYKVLSVFNRFLIGEDGEDGEIDGDSQYDPFTRVYLDGEFFINTSTFWKANYESRPKSRSYSPFESFGLCEKKVKFNVVDLKDVFDRFFPKFKPYSDIGPTLNVGLFPLSKDYKVKYRLTSLKDPAENLWGFLTDSLEYPDYQKELKDAIDVIKDKKVHIACFPEMIMCDQSLYFLYREVEKCDLPFLIVVGGSFHRKDGSGEIQNIMPVTLFINNKMIMEYEYTKILPFHTSAENFLTAMGVTINAPDFPHSLGQCFTNPEVMNWSADRFAKHAYLGEHVSGGSSLLVLDFGRYGSMGFAICRDVVEDPSVPLLGYYPLIDHLFVASFNYSEKAEFFEALSDWGVIHKIASFYVNARSSDSGNKSPSFYCIPKSPPGFSESPELPRPRYEHLEIKDEPYLFYSIDLKGKHPRI